MVNNQRFWHEVWLLAKNNYGSWTTREGIVLHEINDILWGSEERFAN
jgi:hypothetical protein